MPSCSQYVLDTYILLLRLLLLIIMIIIGQLGSDKRDGWNRTTYIFMYFYLFIYNLAPAMNITIDAGMTLKIKHLTLTTYMLYHV